MVACEGEAGLREQIGEKGEDSGRGRRRKEEGGIGVKMGQWTVACRGEDVKVHGVYKQYY